MRTQDEIVERYKQASKRDLFGFEANDYLACLDFDHLRPLLDGEASDAEKDKARETWTVSTMATIDKEAKEYLPFWLDKIEGERGLSVCRGTNHFTAWKWLLGHSDADTFPGSIRGGDGGWYQRRAYDYIKNQIDSGEWDRLSTGAAQQLEPTTR